MNTTQRRRFLNFIKNPKQSKPIVSPFLPHEDVIKKSLEYLNLPFSENKIQNEILLSQKLDYEPMFMTDCPELIFNWQVDEERSDENFEISVIQTEEGEWIRKFPQKEISWNEDAPRPVQTEEDHKKFVLVCEQIGDRESVIRNYYRTFRSEVGENGVLVLSHPHPSWLGYQINPQTIFYHWTDFKETFKRSMDALYEASLFVMSIALEEGIDFTSDSSFGLEMTSPQLFEEMDLPYIQSFAKWTHENNGLFWYHNCGFTRQLISDGYFNKFGADVIETIVPLPEGDNNLEESRKKIDSSICTRGNFNLISLRDGNPDEIKKQVGKMVKAVTGYPHIFSTADGILEGTPPENYITFVTETRSAIEKY